MKTKSLILLCIILFVSNFVIANGFMGEIREQDAIIEELQAEPTEDTITMTEDFTLIRNSEDYIYLTELTINRELWKLATKHTDINGITWYEIMQDGYIKVYAEGHVMPDSIHWYSPY
ncbi:MAG: hypothetical protein BWX78_01824 [Firmicutes bacterium ADurb.Bin099]|nr:MAG: hypothetical protein BWX78_01824 [Firmicutes bacterium ADurb.Bin099]